MPMLRSFWSGVDLDILFIHQGDCDGDSLAHQIVALAIRFRARRRKAEISPPLHHAFVLPAVMRERLVRFRHTMCVVLLLDRVAFIAARRNELGSQTLAHVLVSTGP